ncbi:MAG: DMT family transporter [Roseibium sp.]|uniref:DMT family transporter n=1 Tax=Roseibium sp. TaxID=1936156 RepID=UPI00260D4C35|nr:DMT family transporter [Roseibium sp.]MCV0427686.1 DMT family transporter [Roseibium sp.]
MAQHSPEQQTLGGAASTTPIAGIGLLVLALLGFSLLDATAKYLSASLPVLQIAWMRFVTHVILTLIFFQIWKAPSLFKTKRPFLQIIRALCLLGITIFNFLAVRYLQLAETTSIMFAAPFVITALAGPMLGEWAGLRRWVAIVVGFAGVLVVTQPGMGGMHWAVIYSVIAMIFFAVYALLTRQLTATESSAGMLIISGVVASVAMAPAGLSVWVMPEDVWTWVLLFALGAFGAGGHFLFILAHRVAPAPVLAPFNYTQIIWMIALGYFIFADVPTLTTLVGAAIVISSGLYILYRERVRGI